MMNDQMDAKKFDRQNIMKGFMDVSKHSFAVKELVEMFLRHFSGPLGRPQAFQKDALQTTPPGFPDETHIETPVWSFVIGVVLTLLVFLAFAWQGWQLQQQLETSNRYSTTVTREASSLRHLDNAMIVASFMASHTNQSDWRERHARLAKELEKSIVRTRALMSDKATRRQLQELAAARSLLSEIEADAFSYLEDGDLPGAQDVLANPIYASNHILFGHRMTFFLRDIQGLVEQQTAAFTAKAQIFFWILAGGFGLIFVAWYQVYRTQRSYAAENQTLHADMETRVVQRTHSLNEQITQTNLAQTALRSRETQLRAALDNMSDGIFMLDSDLNYITFNQRYIELTGIPADFIQVGQPIQNVLEFSAQQGLYGPGDPQEQVSQRMVSYTEDSDLEIELETPEGRTLSLRKTSVENGGAVAVLSDRAKRLNNDSN